MSNENPNRTLFKKRQELDRQMQHRHFYGSTDPSNIPSTSANGVYSGATSNRVICNCGQRNCWNCNRERPIDPIVSNRILYKKRQELNRQMQHRHYYGSTDPSNITSTSANGVYSGTTSNGAICNCGQRNCWKCNRERPIDPIVSNRTLFKKRQELNRQAQHRYYYPSNLTSTSAHGVYSSGATSNEAICNCGQRNCWKCNRERPIDPIVYSATRNVLERAVHRKRKAERHVPVVTKKTKSTSMSSIHSYTSARRTAEAMYDTDENSDDWETVVSESFATKRSKVRSKPRAAKRKRQSKTSSSSRSGNRTPRSSMSTPRSGRSRSRPKRNRDLKIKVSSNKKMKRVPLVPLIKEVSKKKVLQKAKRKQQSLPRSEEAKPNKPTIDTQNNVDTKTIQTSTAHLMDKGTSVPVIVEDKPITNEPMSNSRGPSIQKQSVENVTDPIATESHPQENDVATTLTDTSLALKTEKPEDESKCPDTNSTAPSTSTNNVCSSTGESSGTPQPMKPQEVCIHIGSLIITIDPQIAQSLIGQATKAEPQSNSPVCPKK